MELRNCVLNFTDAHLCTTRAHCTTCRDREGGRAWRESAGRVFALPQAGVDFECPFGVGWGASTAPLVEVAVAPAPPQPAPKPWPLYIRAVATLRQPGDVGLGDTVQRLAARVGGEKYKRLMAKLGKGCGCSARQAALNATYAYT